MILPSSSVSWLDTKNSSLDRHVAKENLNWVSLYESPKGHRLVAYVQTAIDQKSGACHAH